MAAFDENSAIALGKNPIPGDKPCGIEVAEDEEYLRLQAEMGKLDRIEAGEPDWYAIEQMTTSILSSKSKDIEVAACLGFALFKRHGYPGLVAALGLLTEMVNSFWDGMFPERPRRRKNQAEWLADRFTEGGWFRDNQPRPDDFDALDLCQARTQELNTALTAKMPDEPPEFGKFTRGLKELADRRPKPAASGETGGGATPASGPSPAAPLPTGQIADVGGAVSQILAAASFIREADRANPIPYAVARVVKWSKISLPTSEAAKLQIEPPEATKVDALTHQFGNGLWEHLLKNAEGAFRSGDPLWLDLQRYVCAAMAGLGPEYEKARQTVIALTAGLVNRLGEGIFELRFRTGLPLCSGETRMWIESEAGQAKGSGSAIGAGATDGRLAEASASARQLAGSGKLKEALKELQDGLAGCSHRRDRFLWRLTMAQLLFEAQRAQLACPLLEECEEEIRRYHIDEWEPALAGKAAEMLYRCRKALISAQKEPSAEALDRMRRSFAWLCQLDPLGALGVEPTGN